MISGVARTSYISKKVSIAKKQLKIFFSNNPATYLVVVSILALVGYAYLLAFPVATFLAITNLYILSEHFSDFAKLPEITAWFIALTTGTLVTYRIIKLRICQPRGIKLDKDKAPELFKLLDSIQAQYGKVNLDRVILNEENKITFVKVPSFGLPVHNNNSLIIGMPVLINLTKNQFKSALARKIYQHTHCALSIPNWITWLRQSWMQYFEAYKKQKKFGHFPLRIFFKFYAPMFQNASILAARLDELNVDSKLLSEVNDEDLLDMIQGEFISKFFLENAYWPRVRKFVRKSPSSTVLPHQKMAEIMHRGLPQKDAMQLLADALEEPDSEDNPTPSLKTRMNNIGHQRIKVPYQTNNNAAQAYLGSSYLAYVRVIDISWMSSTLSDWKKQDKDLKQDYSELKSLRKKANTSRLSYREMLVFSRLSKKLYGKDASLDIKNILLKRVPQAA